MKKDEALQYVADIKMLRSMAIAASPFRNNKKTYIGQRRYDDVTESLRDMRQGLRDTSGDKLKRLKSVSDHETIEIKNALISLLLNKRFRESIKVGRMVGAEYKPVNAHRDKPEVHFSVGHMWKRRVFDSFYMGGHFENKADFLILSAQEYKTNALQVRLWRALVYDFKLKATFAGWIGQSKINRQAVYKNSIEQAVTAAQKLGRETINKKLSGEI